MSNFIKVACVSEVLPGSGKACSPPGQTIALFHLVAGGFYAIDNKCLHRGGRLGEGTLEGSIVTCPLHGWRFDVTTGNCLDRPGQKLKCHEVQILVDDVLVDVPVLAEQSELVGDRQFLVRFGAMGHVGRFHGDGSVACSRGSRVIVRTSRGLEIGEVLLFASSNSELLRGQPESGHLLREMTEDDLGVERLLRQGQQRAFDACRQLLADTGLAVELVDAEQLFDAETLIFYFLGEPPSALADVTAQLATQYEARVQFRPFGEDDGTACGSECGKGGDGNCGSCGEDNCGQGKCGSEG